MGIVKREEILAIQKEDGRIICANCMTDQEWDTITESQIITRDSIDAAEEVYFCDVRLKCDGTQL